MVELHVHLSKGHAWEWEERRRLQELEDNFIRQETSQCQSPKMSPALSDPVIPLAPIDAAQAFLEPAEDHVEELPDRTAIPPELIDSLEYPKPIRSMQTYSDGYTPIQLFLYGGGIVSEGIRGLIKQMLEPNPSERPSAAAVLQRLESLRCEEQ